MNSLQRLFNACSHHFSRYKVQAISHTFFLTEKWEERTDLLIFPGGRDLAYQKQLAGEGNARIRSYVYQGGRFLGICAGGYYGAQEIEFEKGGNLEVCGSRELGFFPGKAVGPAYGSGCFRYENEEGARGALISWGECELSCVYFHGGCLFQDAESYPSTQVLAKYWDLPNKPAACILSTFGKGLSLLSGIHPEYSPADPFFHYLFNKILTL